MRPEAELRKSRTFLGIREVGMRKVTPTLQQRFHIAKTENNMPKTINTAEVKDGGRPFSSIPARASSAFAGSRVAADEPQSVPASAAAKTNSRGLRIDGLVVPSAFNREHSLARKRQRSFAR